MDTVKQWVLFASGYPDVVAIIAGTLAAWAGGLSLERYFVPSDWDVRHQKGVVWLFCVPTGTILSTAIWTGMDGADPMELRISGSLAAAMIAMVVYPFLSRWATKRWPDVGTAWAEPAK